MLYDPCRRQISRRDVLKAGGLGAFGFSLPIGASAPTAVADISVGQLPVEPLEIGRQPQFLFDLHVVDCTWALEEKQEPVKRVLQSCQKHTANPLLTGDDPTHLWVVRDEDGLFRMYYQLNERIRYEQPRQKGQPHYRSFAAYAHSADGLTWERPKLDLFQSQPGGTALARNCILHRPGSSALKPFNCPQILDVPSESKRGYRYLMMYLGAGPGSAGGIHLVGSQDGIRWDMQSDTQLSPIASDHHNTIVYDPRLGEYVMYLRAKHIYLRTGQKGGYDTIEPGAAGERLNTGQSRRGVARMTSKDLWTQWQGQPQQVVAPDELDAHAGYNFFYGMPVKYFAGIYWGFIQVFRMNDFMHVELAWSRDGIHFERLPTRPRLIGYGPDGSWDDTMTLACPNWIEVGNEWWVYYCGSDGPHDTSDKGHHTGLAKFRKEGFVALHGPRGGGVVCTRQIRWPGGSLQINANAHAGELRVRVSDSLRKPLEGYNYEDCGRFTGDSTSHEVTWGGRSLDALRGQVIRLEFFLKEADLYTFRAANT